MLKRSRNEWNTWKEINKVMKERISSTSTSPLDNNLDFVFSYVDLMFASVDICEEKRGEREGEVGVV